METPVPRKIQPAAVALIDGLIQNNPLAQDCLAQGPGRARQLFVEVVKSCLGIDEEGTNQGKEVQIFQKTVGLSAGDSWCMAFMQTGLAYVEKKLGVVSPVFASGGCVNTWQKTPVAQRVKLLPLAGAVAIWQHQNDPTHGHTGMVLDCDGVSFHAIEGNTADGGESLGNEVGQTGQGVRFTHRRYDLFNPHNGDMLLLGSLKPF
jgi:hypothetical protein